MKLDLEDVCMTIGEIVGVAGSLYLGYMIGDAVTENTVGKYLTGALVTLASIKPLFIGGESAGFNVARTLKNYAYQRRRKKND